MVPCSAFLGCGRVRDPRLPAGEGWGESLIQLFRYGLAVLQAFVVPEAEDGDTFARQENCPRGVLSAGFGVVVLSAVNFDSQPCFVTIEVQYIWELYRTVPTFPLTLWALLCNLSVVQEVTHHVSESSRQTLP